MTTRIFQFQFNQASIIRIQWQAARCSDKTSSSIGRDEILWQTKILLASLRISIHQTFGLSVE